MSAVSSTLRLSLACAAALVWMTAAQAEVIVLSAKGGSLKAGDTIADNATIDLPSGATIEVLLPTGAMRTLSGPSKTAVASLTKGEKPDAGLFSKVAELVGKTGGSESSVGAVRAAPATRATRPPAFSWTAVPIEADGDWCVEKGSPLSLVRSAGERPLKVTLVDVAASQRTELTFDAGKADIPWPEAFAPKVGSYAVLVPDRPMRQIRLRLIAPLPSREDTLRVLHGQRCEVQMRAFLSELTQTAAR
jgi:hypothetical protein